MIRGFLLLSFVLSLSGCNVSDDKMAFEVTAVYRHQGTSDHMRWAACSFEEMQKYVVSISTVNLDYFSVQQISNLCAGNPK